MKKVKNISALILAGTLMLAGLSSCRSLVFEDRMECPSFVFFDIVDLNSLPESQKVSVEVRTDPDGLKLASDTLTFGRLGSRDYYLEVTKSTKIVASGISGVRTASQDGSQWTVATGSQWDPVYVFSAWADAMGEETHVPVVMRKEHSVVTVRFISVDSVFPYYVVAKSNTVGLNTASGEPVKGLFRYTPVESAPGVFQFTVPRQGDYSLSLEMWAKPGVSSESGKVDEVLLWSALERIQDFSWSAVNLPDITVDLDYVRSMMTVIVNDWKEEVNLDYTI